MWLYYTESLVKKKARTVDFHIDFAIDEPPFKNSRHEQFVGTGHESGAWIDQFPSSGVHPRIAPRCSNHGDCIDKRHAEDGADQIEKRTEFVLRRFLQVERWHLSPSTQMSWGCFR